jgi:hypothetical protein
MIDTIVLVLTPDMYQLSEPALFTPSAAWAINNAQSPHGIQSKQGHTKKELRAGIYKPRLTLSSRIAPFGEYINTLKIELSLPKLLFGNNFDELRYKDIKPVVQKLVAVLATMGVITTATVLMQAPVATIHYSKNIILTDGSTPYHYINKIKEANIHLTLDVNQTDYRNEGYAFKWHCNSYEVVFYDKIKELEKAQKSSKRAIEKDNEVHHNLFDNLHKRYMLEVLRMEVRLNKKQKMKHVFGKLGINTTCTLKKLCKPAIAKKVLLHYLDELESKRPLLLNYQTKNAESLLVDLIFNNPDKSCKQIVQIFGLKQALDLVSPRTLRSLFSRSSTRTWNRLLQEAHSIKLPRMHNPLSELREQLMAFKPASSKIFKKRVFKDR